MALRAGLWLFADALLTLVLVNNAKFTALREPFVFQDYEYFTDAIRPPRLYIPFLGWWKFMAAAFAVVIAVAIGLGIEDTPDARFSWAGQIAGIVTAGIGDDLLGAHRFNPYRAVAGGF